jgi:hypothetical protein
VVGSHDVIVTLCIMTEQVNSATAVALLPSSPTGRADVLAGMSQLPDGCGVAVRLLGAHVEDCAGRICSMFGQEVRPRMHTRTFDFESQPSTIGGTQCPS